MNAVVVAVLIVLILAVGVYIGISGLSTQYAVDASRGSAAQVLCAPDVQTSHVGQTVRFALSGLTPGTAYHWSADEGTAQIMPDGRFSIVYATRGVKNAWAFVLAGTFWQQIRCSVTVQ
jgi:hypothetical protein